MQAYVNFAALGLKEIRSDALGPLDSVAHPLDPGSYRGAIWRGDSHIGDFEIIVEEGGTGEQVEVDFAHFEQGGGPLQFVAGAVKGQKLYAVFHSDGEAKGYRVTLHDGKRDKPRFDSRKLGKADYFIFMPVQPGKYVLEGTGKLEAKGKLIVEEAKPIETARASGLGGNLKFTEKGFSPSELKVRSGDGVVVEIAADGVAIIARLGVEKDKKPRIPDTPIRYPGRTDLDAGKDKGARGKK